MANFDLDSSGADLGTIQLSLNVQIERGLDGVWGVKHAHVVGPTQGPAASLSKPNLGLSSKLSAEPNGPRMRTRFQKPKKIKVVWRPKSISKPKPIQTQPGSSPTVSKQNNLKRTALTSQLPTPETASCSASPSCSVSPKPATLSDTGVTALVPHPGKVVKRTWGSSSDWVLELRDGRRLSILVSLLRPYLGEFQESEPAVPGGLRELVCAGDVSGLSDVFSGDESENEGEFVVGADSEFSTRDGVVTC
jgi:hypothetical protein